MSDAPASPDAALPRGLAEPAFDPNSMRVLKERYFARKADGSAETPKEFLWRVASAIAEPERPYAKANGRDPDAVASGVAHAFYDMMSRRDFMPNTPCLVNAGRPLSMLSACFVLPVPDSIEGIFYNLQAMALIQKSGGGTGFSFSELRAGGALVESTGKDASGPVSFMKVFNSATDSIKQGGVRRGANMGVLRVDHPDVFQFMHCKKELDAENKSLYNRLSDSGQYTDVQLRQLKQELLQTQINNFNISIGVTDAFMTAVENDSDFDLIDPRTKQVVRIVPAREIWDAIVEGAWQNGEPGVLFLDHPEWNPLPGLGPIQATNPCVTADTMVNTTEGLRPVAQLVGRQFMAIVDGEPHLSTERGFFFTGLKTVYEIETDEGPALRATADHEILVLDRQGNERWTTIGNLKLGDRLALHRRVPQYAHGENTAQPPARTRPFATLTSSRVAGRQLVFDCEIPTVHAFDANGFYVHNCGEQALHGYDSCNLGSINVGHFYDSSSKDVDWERLAQATALAIRFLDNVIDANIYPLAEISEMVRNNRRVGLGIMGFADLLILLGIPYGSPQSVTFSEKLMKFLRERAEETSEQLARERGEFPNKHLSVWADDPRPRRNAALLSIAPTGTISMIAGCSFGCEPYFGMAYTKHVMKDAEGRPQHLYYVVPLFEEIAKDEGFYSDELLGKIEENRGSLKGLSEVPQRWQDVFTVAADVSVDQHIDMLAACQKWTCNAVSKTINAPNGDTRENVGRAIFRAYKAGCKGFTYYRDGSRTEQVVTFSKDGDIKGSNRDIAAKQPSAGAPTTAAGKPVPADLAALDVDALLARANSLLEVR
jgi:ribonucleoside-diphosphate reductase alpha chain